MIAFELPRKSTYNLEVFNTLGQTVFENESTAGPGLVEVTFDGSDLASGAYFYRVTVGDESLARKMMLVK
jgi:hypothetical protein